MKEKVKIMPFWSNITENIMQQKLN